MLLNRVVTATALAVGGFILSKRITGKARRADAGAVEESIEVHVPRGVAYHQWTQFEQLPSFMHSVKEVRQLDSRHLHWKATVDGQDTEWDVEITERVPDQRLAWRSIGAPRNSGAVSFTALSDEHTRVTLKMAAERDGTVEKIGDMLGAMRLEARSNLQRFKEMIEARGAGPGDGQGQITAH
ncbi:SRPBCC family protein [Massilia sp. DWR3-1-1]|uniref:SRPBCC family protein n=1 Tax=Massilia sp. DWR3-1-1 TaxID=2804559 RepID=UPI003CF7ABBB